LFDDSSGFLFSFFFSFHSNHTRLTLIRYGFLQKRKIVFFNFIYSFKSDACATAWFWCWT